MPIRKLLIYPNMVRIDKEFCLINANSVSNVINKESAKLKTGPHIMSQTSK